LALRWAAPKTRANLALLFPQNQKRQSSADQLVEAGLVDRSVLLGVQAFFKQ